MHVGRGLNQQLIVLNIYSVPVNKILVMEFITMKSTT